MSINDLNFTAQLYGEGQFKYSIDDPRLPEGFITYHKKNFCTYFSIEESHFNKYEVLDTGCGPGKHAIVLALMGANVTACDLSNDNLIKAKALKRFYGLNNINFYQYDLMKPFTLGDSFDLVSAHNWMQHTETPSLVFVNLINSMKIGGKIYLSLYLAGTFRFFITQIARSILKRGDYQLGREMVKYFFPLGFKGFNNPDDICMENIFDDFFVPYCNTTTYETVLSDAEKSGCKLLSNIPDSSLLHNEDNLPLRVTFEKVTNTVAHHSLDFNKPIDEFVSPKSREIEISIALASKAIEYFSHIDNPIMRVSFAMGLYRVRAETCNIRDSKLKHDRLRQYLELTLDHSSKAISSFYDTQTLHGIS